MSTTSTVTLMEIMDMMKKLLDDKVQKFSTHDDLKNSKTTIEAKIEKFASVIFDIVKENRTLKEKIRIMEESINKESKTLARLEQHIKRKNIIIRGVKKNHNLEAAVDEFVDVQLQMDTPIGYEGVSKVNERGDKMDILVELKSQKMKYDIFRHAPNLKGTSIVLEHDLIPEQLQDKKVLIQLRREILAFNNTHFIIVRSDRMRVGGYYFKWNKDKELMCGRHTAEEYLATLYGADAFNINLNYDTLLSKVN